MFFDNETNGLPATKEKNVPATRIDHWPRVIQLAWSLTDLENKELSWGNYLIKPEGWAIPDGTDGKDASFWIKHGYNTAKSLAEGVPIADAVGTFNADLQSADVLVSHNMEFDHKVLGAEFIRLGVRSERVPFRICTKEASTNYCKIPHAWRKEKRPWMIKDFKWPTMAELHMKLFGKPFDNAHDAGGDVAALRVCFFELVRLKVISLENIAATQRQLK
jgi:DNA polymerase-3 subunit epsilon